MTTARTRELLTDLLTRIYIARKELLLDILVPTFIFSACLLLFGGVW